MKTDVEIAYFCPKAYFWTLRSVSSKRAKSHLIEKDGQNDDWIQDVKISVSSYFDIALATRGDKGVIFQPKFLNDSSCQVMNFSASAEINSLFGEITASAVLPGSYYFLLFKLVIFE